MSSELLKMANTCTDRAEDTMQEKQANTAKTDTKEKKVTVEQIRAVLAEKFHDGRRNRCPRPGGA